MTVLLLLWMDDNGVVAGRPWQGDDLLSAGASSCGG